MFTKMDAPILIYELKEDCMKHEPRPRIMRRCFVEQDQYAYARYIMRPNDVYVVPPNARYLILTVQKTLFSVDVMDWDVVQNLQDFRSHTTYTMEVYNLPPPTPAHDFEEAPSMMRPEHRIGKKLASRKRSGCTKEPQFLTAKKTKCVPPEEPSVLMSPEEQYVFMPPEEQQHVLMPPEEPSVLMSSMPPEEQHVLMSSMPTFEDNQLIGFEDSVLNVEPQNWESIFECNFPHAEITAFINNFEAEVSRLAPEKPQPQNSVNYNVPPPSDNYWEANVPEVIESTSFPGESQEPMDLTTTTTGPKRQHALKIVSPLDLSIQTL